MNPAFVPSSAVAHRAQALGASSFALSPLQPRLTIAPRRGCVRVPVALSAHAAGHAGQKLSILVPEKLSKEGIAILTKQFDVVEKYDLTPQQLIEEIEKHNAIIVRSATQVTKELLAAGKNLKVVGRAGVGVDNIDLVTASERGVLVVNAPTSNCVAAAEHTIALMAALARLVAPADAVMKAGGWDRNKFVGVSLVNKTLALLGLGRIGREVARRAKGLGMRVVAYDPYMSQEVAKSMDVELLSLDEAISIADFVSPHLPLLDSTKNLLSKAQFAKMKKGVRVLNVARGGVVNEEALLEALDSGHVAGAALDCFEFEPPHKHPESISARIVKHPKVLATPHLGASTVEAQEDVAIEIAEAVCSALNGELVSTMVNAPPIPSEMLKKLKPRAVLGERLASLAYRVAGGLRNGHITIRYNLEEPNENLRLVRTGIVRGLLAPSLDVPINIVNAENLTKAKGLKIEEITHVVGSEEDKSITVQINSSLPVTGRILNKRPYLTQIGDYMTDIPLEGILMIYNHIDRPGQIGKLGTFLGQLNINISDMTVARKGGPGSDAAVVLKLDSIPSESSIAEIRKLMESSFGPVIVDYSKL